MSMEECSERYRIVFLFVAGSEDGRRGPGAGECGWFLEV